MKKLNKENVEELKRRYAVINQHLLTADALHLHTKQYTNKMLADNGYDVEKKAYNIDLKTGEVIEVKEEKKK
jgi:hypothetical protein